MLGALWRADRARVLATGMFALLGGILVAGVVSGAPARSSDPLRGTGRYVFRLFGDEEVLSNLTAECLLQDRTGFLWVGTQDGLFRFDGRRFARFGREEGLPSTRINCLHETADGRLYAGTRAGVARREGDRFVAVKEAAGLPEIAIPDEGVVSDARGSLFVATPRGLYVGTAGRFRLEPRTDGKEAPVTGLHVAPNGSLFFGREGSLYRRDASGRTEEFGAARGLTDLGQINQTITDREGRLWVRTLKALSVLAPRSAAFQRDDEGLPAGVGSGRLALDERGEVMLPTERGLARRVEGRWGLIGRAQGLETEAVLSALVDREGSLWLGLAGVGLAQQLGRGTFTSWGTVEGLPHDVVWSIAREKKIGAAGVLWVGTQAGIARFDPQSGSVRAFVEKDGLGGNTVYALLATEDGSVWAGSWPGGVTRFGPEPDRIRRYAGSDLPLSEFRVAALFAARNGDIWAGARSGLYRLLAGAPGDRFEKVVQPPDGEEPDSVFAFAEDSAGALWAAGRYGLERLSAAEPRRWRQKDGLRADFLASIVGMPDGSLVAGYREALGAERISFSGGSLQTRPIDRSAGLTADKVILLGRDAAGSLWIGSGSGLDVFAGSAARPTHYGRSSGLVSEDMDQNAFLPEPDGSFRPTRCRPGLIRYEPGRDASPRARPPIVLTEVEAGGRRLDPSQQSAPVRLSRQERTLRIAWAALTFVDPKRVRYRYQLPGLVDAPVETFQTEARFSPLSSGRYRFEVAAIGADSRASEPPASFSFEVAPAWWQMWWVRGAAAILTVLFVLGAVRLRTRELEAERRRLEEAVVAGRAELAAANRELEEASFTDPLTGLRNRRYFSAVIDGDLLRCLRAFAASPAGQPPRQRDLIFYLMDLDDFKAVNDLYGHEAGDRVLVETAARLVSAARQSDMLVRWGGEEFLVVSHDADRSDGDALGRRILEVMAREPFDAGEGRTARLTCSIGWAPFPWALEEPSARSHEEVLRLADRALYIAKEGGRNRAIGAMAASADASREAGGIPFRIVVTPGPENRGED
jgi:diguanylate cyclase (GGDEF)-like protein